MSLRMLTGYPVVDFESDRSHPKTSFRQASIIVSTKRKTPRFHVDLAAGNDYREKMKLISIIKDFIAKAKQEAARDYHLDPMIRDITSSTGSGEKEPTKKGWIGIDLDGTLARSDTSPNPLKIGDAVPKMLNRVNQLIQDGHRIKIFTARASDPEQIPIIKKWLKENELPEFEITNIKDYGMIRLYDDRAVQVIPNTGEIVESAEEGS
jgi:hypothetical protein